MTSKLYSTAIYDDLTNKNVPAEQQDYLLNLFGNVIKRMAATLARKSYYQLADFHGVKNHGVEGFDLEIKRNSTPLEDGTIWESFEGKFTNGNKVLELEAHLEDY